MALTPNLFLNKPERDALGWTATVNGNFDTIDTALAAVEAEKSAKGTGSAVTVAGLDSGGGLVASSLPSSSLSLASEYFSLKYPYTSLVLFPTVFYKALFFLYGIPGYTLHGFIERSTDNGATFTKLHPYPMVWNPIGVGTGRSSNVVEISASVEAGDLLRLAFLETVPPGVEIYGGGVSYPEVNEVIPSFEPGPSPLPSVTTSLYVTEYDGLGYNMSGILAQVGTTNVWEGAFTGTWYDGTPYVDTLRIELAEYGGVLGWIASGWDTFFLPISTYPRPYVDAFLDRLPSGPAQRWVITAEPGPSPFVCPTTTYTGDLSLTLPAFLGGVTVTNYAKTIDYRGVATWKFMPPTGPGSLYDFIVRWDAGAVPVGDPAGKAFAGWNITVHSGGWCFAYHHETLGPRNDHPNPCTYCHPDGPQGDFVYYAHRFGTLMPDKTAVFTVARV